MNRPAAWANVAGKFLKSTWNVLKNWARKEPGRAGKLGNVATFEQRKSAVLSHLWQRRFVRLEWKPVWEGAAVWLGAGAEGAVQKDQQFCLHLAARVTLAEEMSPVREPRELCAWCHAAGEPLAAETTVSAALLQNATHGRGREKSQAKLPCLYQGLCELRLVFSVAGRGGSPKCGCWFVGTALRQPWGCTGKHQGWIWAHKALLCLQSSEWHLCAVTQLWPQGSSPQFAAFRDSNRLGPLRERHFFFSAREESNFKTIMGSYFPEKILPISQ